MSQVQQPVVGSGEELATEVTQGQQESKTCRFCGKVFYRKDKDYDSSWARRKSCSLTCRTIRMKPIDRFWVKVNKQGPIPERRPELGPCWVWIGYLRENGYGLFSVFKEHAGRCMSMTAHVWIYEETVAVVPDHLDLDHLCRNRACVNPTHLEPVTRLENIMRGVGPEMTRRRLLA